MNPEPQVALGVGKTDRLRVRGHEEEGGSHVLKEPSTFLPTNIGSPHPLNFTLQVALAVGKTDRLRVRGHEEEGESAGGGQVILVGVRFLPGWGIYDGIEHTIICND